MRGTTRESGTREGKWGLGRGGDTEVRDVSTEYYRDRCVRRRWGETVDLLGPVPTGDPESREWTRYPCTGKERTDGVKILRGRRVSVPRVPSGYRGVKHDLLRRRDCSKGGDHTLSPVHISGHPRRPRHSDGVEEPTVPLVLGGVLPKGWWGPYRDRPVDLSPWSLFHSGLPRPGWSPL